MMLRVVTVVAALLPTIDAQYVPCHAVPPVTACGRAFMPDVFLVRRFSTHVQVCTPRRNCGHLRGCQRR